MKIIEQIKTVWIYYRGYIEKNTSRWIEGVTLDGVLQ